MFLLPDISDLLIAALVLLLAVAAYTDLARFTISNRLNIAVFGFGLAFKAIDPAGLPMAFAAAAGVFAFGAFLFFFRLLGGGDVKLLAAVAIWAGPMEVMPFLFQTVLFGGALSILWVMSGRLRLMMAYVGLDVDPRVPNKIPYGIAIAAAGGLLAMRLHGMQMT